MVNLDNISNEEIHIQQLIIAWGLNLNFLLNIQALMNSLKYFMPMITIDL
jgi:hypothetical protein